MSNLKKQVTKVEDLRPFFEKLSDDELKSTTEKLKRKLSTGSSLDDILPEAFAAVREATKRAHGTEHYPVQIMGGIALHRGNIAEMKTGEGKTQTCFLPAYLNCLEERGVHIVTVNDYLAQRDAHEAKEVMDYLGVSVGCVLASSDNLSRRAAYMCDITYVTNSEAGFDYLRDNMVTSAADKVQRGLHYAIIDEVDSILIDEARTPLIISGNGPTPSSLYTSCDALAKRLKAGEKEDVSRWEESSESGDYITDEKEKTAVLTERGVKKVEKYFGLKNYSDAENSEIQHGMIMALKANSLMHKNKDYVVQDGKVNIVDEFTGRVLDGRRYSDGLHQAIEAKEGVEIQTENMTVATITFQHYFNKYKKKSGMTGTAMTEKNEFRDIYKMGVIGIPTNRPVIRADEQDRVYVTKKEKYHAVVEEVIRAHERNQPVLVGTTTVETSELLSRLLRNRDIPHQVLNAKQHAREAEIVALAGNAGAVTIATNMAGRGTDIKLDDLARSAGGLYVIGTERHEARRIDNQLRGRSGRQGDPGRSVFFLSLEDDLIRRYGNEEVLNAVRKMVADDNQVIRSKSLSRAIEKSQLRIEGQHYNVRKSLLDYDDVNNEQRELIYKERDLLLCDNSIDDVILRMARMVADDICVRYGNDDTNFTIYVKRMFQGSPEPQDLVNDESKRAYVGNLIETGYNKVKEQFPSEEMFEQFAHSIFLKILDERWMRHIDDLAHLREGIGLRTYGQKDPRVEYKTAAYDMFDRMLRGIRGSVVSIIYSTKVNVRLAVRPTEQSLA